MTRANRVFFAIAAAGFLALAPALPARAQARFDTRPVTFLVDLGYINLADYPKWIALGPEVELRLGRFLSLNPEASIWLRQSRGGTVQFVPGATANVHIGRFSIGGGAVRRVSDWSESAGGALVPKFQVGLRSGPTRLTLAGYYLNVTNDVVLSLTVGIGVGRREPRDPDD
jgi:hypothetical protein